MSSRRWLRSLSFTLFAAACAAPAKAPETPPVDPAALKDAIQAREKEWSAAYLAGNGAAIAASIQKTERRFSPPVTRGLDAPASRRASRRSSIRSPSPLAKTSPRKSFPPATNSPWRSVTTAGRGRARPASSLAARPVATWCCGGKTPTAPGVCIAISAPTHRRRWPRHRAKKG